MRRIQAAIESLNTTSEKTSCGKRGNSLKIKKQKVEARESPKIPRRVMVVHMVLNSPSLLIRVRVERTAETGLQYWLRPRT